MGLGLLESACPKQGSRVMLFLGGPPTIGPGMIVGRPKDETIRSHTDLQKNNAPHFKVRVGAVARVRTRVLKAAQNAWWLNLIGQLGQ